MLLYNIILCDVLIPVYLSGIAIAQPKSVVRSSEQNEMSKVNEA